LTPASHITRYGETLALALALTMEVLRQFGTESDSKRSGPGALAPWQLHRTTSYMHDHLRPPLDLLHLQVGLQEGWRSANIQIRSGVIRGIPAQSHCWACSEAGPQDSCRRDTAPHAAEGLVMGARRK